MQGIHLSRCIHSNLCLHLFTNRLMKVVMASLLFAKRMVCLWKLLRLCLIKSLTYFRRNHLHRNCVSCTSILDDERMSKALACPTRTYDSMASAQSGSFWWFPWSHCQGCRCMLLLLVWRSSEGGPLPNVEVDQPLDKSFL